MLKELKKFLFMIVLGWKYIKIFKQIYFHPFITQKYAYQELSHARQEYSNKVLDFLHIKVKLVGKIPKKNRKKSQRFFS